MANDAVLQVRIDSQLKSEVEQLYRQMGTTFSEAVRLFARQSVLKRRLPFDISERDDGAAVYVDGAATSTGHVFKADAAQSESGFAMLAEYASEEARAREKVAWKDAVVADYVTAQAVFSTEQGGE